MKNKIKKFTNSALDHFERQKFAYLFGAIAVAMVAINRHSTKEFEAFLAEKGIDKMEYYMSDLMAEMNT
jgi:hypothetical protein